MLLLENGWNAVKFAIRIGRVFEYLLTLKTGHNGIFTDGVGRFGSAEERFGAFRDFNLVELMDVAQNRIEFRLNFCRLFIGQLDAGEGRDFLRRSF